MNNQLVISKEVETKIEKANFILDESKKFEIKSYEEYEKAAEDIKFAKNQIKELICDRKKITQPIDESKKAAMELFKKPIDFYEASVAILGNKMKSFKTEQDRILKEKQEKERLKREAEERKIKEKLEAKAQKAIEKGQIEKAEILKEQKEEVFVPEVILPSKPAAPEGIHYRENWKHEIVDISLIPRGYLIPNEKMLAGIAKSTKGQLQIPGVKFYKEDILVTRT
ncbi:MAG: hypothetical protein ACFFE4_00595 [Candidatus Thorarchaeota archaeon]